MTRRLAHIAEIGWETVGIALLVAAVVLIPASVLVWISWARGEARSTHWPWLMLAGVACILAAMAVRRDVRRRRGLNEHDIIEPLRFSDH